MFFQGVLLDDPAEVLHAQGPNTHGAKRMKFTSVRDVESLAEAFNNLTPGRQREHNLHICGAKQAPTRNRRIDKAVPTILAGKGLRDR